MLAIDTEGTGLDHHHGARPFFITIARDDGTQQHWEWTVDPLSRMPDVPPGDIDEIQVALDRAASWTKLGGEVAERHAVVGQNLKYDAAMLATIGVRFPWQAARDTLVAAHLLANNQPHNLTDLAVEYVGEDISPFEDRLGDAVKECRRMVQQARLRVKRRGPAKVLVSPRGKPIPQPEPEEDALADIAAWFIAEEGKPGMPSVKGSSSGREGEKDKVWKNDTWLPRALAKRLGKPQPDPACNHLWADPDDRWRCVRCGGHRWWTVLAEYANTDGAITLLVWQEMYKELHRRNLWAIYQEQMRLPPIIAGMEATAMTVSVPAVDALEREYIEESNEAKTVCVGIAKTYDYDLQLPKSGRNKSFDGFVWDVMRLEKLYQPKGKTLGPTFDAKIAIPHYLETLQPGSRELAFVKSLVRTRKRETSLGYLAAYQRFWLPMEGSDELKLLHSSVNQCGSDTLRFSMQNPNLQQCSKQETQCEACDGEGCEECDGSGEDLHSVRRIFGPAPGREWWSLDAQNIELRLPAYEADEPELIALFEKPNEPPYYGSEHLLNFSTVYPDIWAAELKAVGLEKVGPQCKKKYKSSWYQHVKNGGFACVPMDTEILTMKGWKTYETLDEDDWTLGYTSGYLRWTKILEKIHLTDRPLVRISNRHFSAVCTSDHRWLSERRTGRGRTRRLIDRFTTADGIVAEDNIRLSAPVIDSSPLDLTDDECSLIGFAYGDGSIEKSIKGPGPSRGANQDKVGFRVRIYQSKPQGVDYLDSLLGRWGHGFKKRERKSGGMWTWDLNSAACRDLWRRAGLWDTQEFERFVINLGSSQRRAFLDGVFMAEGDLKSVDTGYRTYSQNRGAFCDGIILAIFLTGRFATTYEKSGDYPTPNVCLGIREAKPRVTGQKMKKDRLEGLHDVWCVKTELGSWVMRQNGRIMLTGNCGYGSLLREGGTADRAFRRNGSHARLTSRFSRKEKLNQYWIAFAERHGYVETMPDRSVDPERGYPLLCTRTERGDVLPTVPLNYHIQGTAMWWMRRAMARCAEQLATWNAEGFDGQMILQVHDELLFDFPKAEPGPGLPRNLWRARRLGELMQKGGEDIGVPTPVSISFHPENWSRGIDIA